MRTALAIILLFTLTGCAGWTVNGIPAERFTDMTAADGAETVAGGIVSAIVHWLSHVVVLEALEIDWHQDGLYERFDGTQATDSQRAWIGRAGPIGQLAGGLFIRCSPLRNTMFATGYNAVTAWEIGTYRMFECGEGDFTEIAYHGDPEAEHAVYTAAAIWLLDIKKTGGNHEPDNRTPH